MWPYSLSVPQASGVIRSCPEDFVVEEIPRFIPEGEGSHLWLWVEKRAANTDWVARELARVADCPMRDVGYAGLKDRHALTRQWFSVPGDDVVADNLASCEIEDTRIIDIQRHTRKLKRGTLNGNRFFLRVRDFDGEIVQIEQRLQQIKFGGVPNYFGPQRFGQHGKNVEKGYSLLTRRVRMQRNKKSIYLSAIRSFVFNHLLAERVDLGNWNTMINGDLAMLDGTRSIFPVELPDTEIEERCKRLDIHPTGPLPGENGIQVLGDAATLEQSVISDWSELLEVLVSGRVQASRRSLRLYATDLAWDFEHGNLELSFTLPPGTYATTVLREILNERV